MTDPERTTQIERLPCTVGRRALGALWDSPDLAYADWVENGWRIVSDAIAAEYARPAAPPTEPQP